MSYREALIIRYMTCTKLDVWFLKWVKVFKKKKEIVRFCIVSWWWEWISLVIICRCVLLRPKEALVYTHSWLQRLVFFFSFFFFFWFCAALAFGGVPVRARCSPPPPPTIESLWQRDPHQLGAKPENRSQQLDDEKGGTSISSTGQGIWNSVGCMTLDGNYPLFLSLCVSPFFTNF